jgi:hypothetical protein
MGKKVIASTSSVRDNTGEPGTDSGSEIPNMPGETPPPTKRRKRGPNKTKPGTFTVRTEAVLSQAEIRKLLTSHAAAMLGTDVAAKMTLQVNVDGEWQELLDSPSASITLQFATVIEADG